MSEIKPWRDRAPKETTSFDYPRVCRETADAEIAELRARVAQQAEMVEKCMVAMNENADRGMKAEQERDELRAALAKSQPVEQGEPAEVQGRPAENFSFMVVDPKDADELIKCGWEIRKLFTHPVRPMSDEQLWALWNSQGSDEMNQTEAIKFARAIEAHIKGATA